MDELVPSIVRMAYNAAHGRDDLRATLLDVLEGYLLVYSGARPDVPRDLVLRAYRDVIWQLLSIALGAPVKGLPTPDALMSPDDQIIARMHMRGYLDAYEAGRSEIYKESMSWPGVREALLTAGRAYRRQEWGEICRVLQSCKEGPTAGDAWRVMQSIENGVIDKIDVDIGEVAGNYALKQHRTRRRQFIGMLAADKVRRAWCPHFLWALSPHQRGRVARKVLGVSAEIVRTTVRRDQLFVAEKPLAFVDDEGKIVPLE